MYFSLDFCIFFYCQWFDASKFSLPLAKARIINVMIMYYLFCLIILKWHIYTIYKTKYHIQTNFNIISYSKIIFIELVDMSIQIQYFKLDIGYILDIFYDTEISNRKLLSRIDPGHTKQIKTSPKILIIIHHTIQN